MSQRLSTFGALPLTVTSAVVLSGADPSQAAINPADFQQVELARGVPAMGEPMSLAALPDNSVLHTARGGELRRTDNAGSGRCLDINGANTADGTQIIIWSCGGASNQRWNLP